MMFQNHGMESGKMKINGQEVDMKQVLAQYEQENRINYSKMKKKGNNVEWWNSTQGMAQREVFRQALLARHDTCHRQKIKYILTDTETEEETEIEGQVELAAFLGYKKFNSDLRMRMLYTKQLSNKSKTKTYNIKETL